MSRDIRDHSAPKAEGKRVVEFVKLKHQDQPNDGTKALQRRPRGESSAKVKAFTKIDREQS